MSWTVSSSKVITIRSYAPTLVSRKYHWEYISLLIFDQSGERSM